MLLPSLSGIEWAIDFVTTIVSSRTIRRAIRLFLGAVLGDGTTVGTSVAQNPGPGRVINVETSQKGLHIQRGIVAC